MRAIRRERWIKTERGRRCGREGSQTGIGIERNGDAEPERETETERKRAGTSEEIYNAINTNMATQSAVA